MEAKQRVHVIISGKVQGVFFRAETQRAAEAVGISGWVRNRRDGTVEAVMEGEPDKIRKMLNWCRKGAPLSRVDKVAEDWESYVGEYEGFSITY
jgi:acylphosphatase